MNQLMEYNDNFIYILYYLLIILMLTIIMNLPSLISLGFI